MKKTVVNVIAMGLLALVATGCSRAPKTASKSPFTQVFETPCEIYDDAENFAATGFASGSAARKGDLQAAALQNAQEMCAMKIKHTVQGLTSTYSEVIGRNGGTDIDSHTQRGIENAIVGIVNETSFCCLRFSEVDDRGNVECYVAIKIPKAQVVDAVAENLSKSEKEEIRDNSEKFRRQMKEKIKDMTEK